MLGVRYMKTEDFQQYWRQAMIDGQDPWKVIAAWQFNVDYAEVTLEQRGAAKNLYYMRLYSPQERESKIGTTH